MRILILEDDPMIALDLQAILEAEGHEVPDALSSLSEAYPRPCPGFDCALLDVDVVGGKSFGVAEALIERQIPFVFVSASKPCDLPRPLQQAAFIAKPYDEQALRDSVGDIAGNRLPC